MVEEREDVRRHYREALAGISADYHGKGTEYPAYRIRLELLTDRLRACGVRTLLDCGCGEGSPLVRWAANGIDVWGFDLVEEMVASAGAKLAAKGLPGRVWRGDVADPASYRPEAPGAPDGFDATLAMGVFPHVEDDVAVLRSMAGSTRPGGRVFASFRNELFSLFTVNRYSHAFVLERLVRAAERSAEHPEFAAPLGEAAKALEAQFRMDLPPPRMGTAEKPGYDAIPSRFHNPLELPEVFRRAGMSIDRIHFYHFHALPPLFEVRAPEAFRTLSLELEADPTDWRGHFMASAFVVEAIRAQER